MIRGLAACVGLAVALCASLASAETFHWVQFGPNGREIRAITDTPTCPAVQVDGVAAEMIVRAAPDRDYPITACALRVPAAARSAALDGAPIALPGDTPTRIAVIGDTGCRLKGPYLQACNDPQQWPFREIAERLAALKPDLVIHVGDYHYRETPFPPWNEGCAGSPFGDNWAVWRADFFAPADALLKTAPFVFVRGNHEECDRGGQGWSRALEPYAFDAASGCNGPGASYVVRLPGLALAVIDVASAREGRIDVAQAQLYRTQYAALRGMTDGPTWLLQHRPIWGPGGTFAGKLVGDNKTLEAAAAGNLPDHVTLVLSGHHHLFQVLEYQADLPVQVVSGHGGDLLNAGSSDNPAGWVVNGVTVKRGLNVTGTFGFSMFEKQNGGWQLTDYDRTGMAQKSCLIKDRTAECR